jgi:hypothetical protein
LIVRFIADVPLEGRNIETCATLVVPPVIVLAKTLSLASTPVMLVAVRVNAAVKMLLFGAPKSAPERLTELW